MYVNQPKVNDTCLYQLVDPYHTFVNLIQSSIFRIEIY